MRFLLLSIGISLSFVAGPLFSQEAGNVLQWYAIAKNSNGVIGEALSYRSPWRTGDSMTVHGEFPPTWQGRILILAPGNRWLFIEPEKETAVVQWEANHDSRAGDYTAWLIFSTGEAEKLTQEFWKSLRDSKRSLAESLVWLRGAQWADTAGSVQPVSVAFAGSIRAQNTVKAHVTRTSTDTPLVVVRYDLVR